MDQRLMGPGECRQVGTGTQQDGSIFVLINHCQDMKQQEGRFRIFTLLLLLSCTALFAFTNWTSLRYHSQIAAEPNLAPLTQEKLCPAEKSGSEFNIQLSVDFSKPLVDNLPICWSNLEFGESQNYEGNNCSVVVPVRGVYFVYMRVTLACYPPAVDYQPFFVKLQHVPDGYGKYEELTKVQDGLDCSTKRFRSIFVGELFSLDEGDHLSVWMEQGSNLIHESWFGASLR